MNVSQLIHKCGCYDELKNTQTYFGSGKPCHFLIMHQCNLGWHNPDGSDPVATLFRADGYPGTLLTIVVSETTDEEDNPVVEYTDKWTSYYGLYATGGRDNVIGLGAIENKWNIATSVSDWHGKAPNRELTADDFEVTPPKAICGVKFCDEPLPDAIQVVLTIVDDVASLVFTFPTRVLQDPPPAFGDPYVDGPPATIAYNSETPSLTHPFTMTRTAGADGFLRLFPGKLCVAPLSQEAAWPIDGVCEPPPPPPIPTRCVKCPLALPLESSVCPTGGPYAMTAYPLNICLDNILAGMMPLALELTCPQLSALTSPLGYIRSGAEYAGEYWFAQVHAFTYSGPIEAIVEHVGAWSVALRCKDLFETGEIRAVVSVYAKSTFVDSIADDPPIAENTYVFSTEDGTLSVTVTSPGNPIDITLTATQDGSVLMQILSDAP